MYCIAIDDGHGKETAGKRTPAFSDSSVMRENEYNEAVAAYLGRLLQENGFQVLFVASEKTDTPLQTRVQRANAEKADIYISIHANAFGNEWNDAKGIESWIYGKADNKTVRLGTEIQTALIRETGRKNRGVKRSTDLYVLNSTKMPAVLVEGGFMTNLEEAELLRSDVYRRKCAVGICKGICKFFGIPYKEGNDVEVERYQSISELPYGQEVIRNLVEEGVLKGDEKGNLNLSEDMVRIFIILDRKGIL